MVEEYRFPDADRSESLGDEFSRIDLDGPEGPASMGESMQSTLYDPAALTLDPKVRAQMEAEYAEKDRRKALGVPDDEKEDLALSPKAPKPGLNPYEESKVDEDEDLVNESPRFCCGLLPLRRCVYAVNILALLVGVISIGIGVNGVIQGSKLNVDGFQTSDALLLSAPKYVYLSCGIGGLLLLTAGILGVVLANDITFGVGGGSQKSMFLVYQGVLVLLVLVFGVLFFVTVIAIAVLSRNNVYDQSSWRTTIGSEPIAACETEIAGSCSGFADSNECVNDKSNIAQQQKNCPGHFCFDFCQVKGETIQNTNAICEVCKPSYDWLKCKEHEVSLEEGSGCEKQLNSKVKSEYLGSMTNLVLVFLTCVICMCLACFRACCLAPLDFDI